MFVQMETGRPGRDVGAIQSIESETRSCRFKQGDLKVSPLVNVNISEIVRDVFRVAR